MARVLVLGATGAVGAGCLETLVRGGEAAIRIAGRDETRLRDAAAVMGADVETARADIADAATVTAAAAGCDVVINCAGPSQTFSAPVAAAVVAAGLAYVDPGGDRALLEALAATEPTAAVVAQAGVQPGLSGLALRALAQHRRARGDRVGAVTAWCGGLQPLTGASVREYLASLDDPHSHPGAALRDGAIRRVGADECPPAPRQCFAESTTVHPHLDAETVAVAAELGVDDVHWMNVLDGDHTKRAARQLTLDDTGDVEAVLAASRLDLFGRRPYFAIVARADDTHGAATLTLTCRDSYRATGAAAALAAHRATEMSASVHPFWTIADPVATLQTLTETDSGTEMFITDDADDPATIEEGSL